MVASRHAPAGVVLVQHLHHEALHLRLRPALVVAAVDVYDAGVQQLVSHHQHADLDTVLATVDEVSVEQVLPHKRTANGRVS